MTDIDKPPSGVATMAGLAIAALFVGIVLLVRAPEVAADAVVSERIQEHGTRVAATISEVHVEKSGGGSGRRSHAPHYVTTWDVSLDHAVGGATHSSIRVAGKQPDEVGERLEVLLDPDDPGYGEPPGRPFAEASTAVGERVAGWIVLPLGVVLAAGAAIGIRRRRTARRRRATATITMVE